MSAIRLFTDEDVYGTVAGALRRNGFECQSVPEVNRRSESDEAQLEWATAQQRAIVTFNVAHFATLHHTWLKHGKHHHGVIVSSQRPMGDTIARLLHLARTLDAEAMVDRLEYLGDW